jgi:four helix bundle protein
VSRQLLRAGTSIGANIEEGMAPQSRRDLAARFAIALREARETKYWLRLIVATDLAPERDISQILQEADELVAILTVTVRKLKQESNG